LDRSIQKISRSKRKYRFAITFVILNKPQIDQLLPFKRVKVSGNIIVSRDSKTLTAEVLVQMFELDDVNLNGTPFAELEVSWVGTRVFHSL